jgi:LCP family protein required for cell wall assembly
MKRSAYKRSRAEKRVLWEIRQRYQINQSGRIKHQAASAPASPSRQSVLTPRSSKYLTRSQPSRPTTRPGGRGSIGTGGGRSHWGRRLFLAVFLLLIATGGIFGYKILAAGNKISVADQSLLGQIKDLLFSSGEFLQGEADGRVNVLLIAIGGEGHKGQDLADTIMVASLQPVDGDIALLSIPRDLYVQVPGEEYFTKINAVHAYGESQKKDHGPEVLRKKVEEITGLTMHYYARIDFIAFKNIVDTVGGINISVDNSFYDYWHKISFPAGTEKMNGERALAFVRARYIEGSEGGDFKRAQRQQQVLLALREKVFSVNTAFDFRAVNAILNSLSENIRTDMQLWEMKRFYELARLINSDQVRSVVLSTGPNGVLVGETEVLGGVPASVLRPRVGDYSEIHAIAANIFSDEISTSLASATVPSESTRPEEIAQREEIDSQPIAAKPTLEIRNGTNVTGLAKRTADTLTDKGYEVKSIGNAANRSTEKTTIYALRSEAIEGAKTVGELLGTATDSGLPEGEEASEADVLIILGQDAQ